MYIVHLSMTTERIQYNTDYPTTNYPTTRVIRHFEFGPFVSLFIIFYTDYPTTRVNRHFFLGPFQCRIIRVALYYDVGARRFDTTSLWKGVCAVETSYTRYRFCRNSAHKGSLYGSFFPSTSFLWEDREDWWPYMKVANSTMEEPVMNSLKKGRGRLQKSAS